jgi:hypothetical protein
MMDRRARRRALEREYVLTKSNMRATRAQAQQFITKMLSDDVWRGPVYLQNRRELDALLSLERQYKTRLDAILESY